MGPTTLISPSGEKLVLERCPTDTDKYSVGYHRAEDMRARGHGVFFSAPCGCIAEEYEYVPSGWGQESQVTRSWVHLCDAHDEVA